MLKRLFLDNCFLHQNKTFIFDKGLTAVTGRNESGKSLIAEMIRFALFGSKALRGEASDYKRLHVELDFSVNDQDYTVIRKNGNAQLFDSGSNLIANGAAVVNKVIPEVFGYDLIVFDTANACNQGAVEALSNMRPAERKKMVDQTLGLNVLDDLLSWVGEQALVSKRLVDALEPTLEAPLEPSKPKSYLETSNLKRMLDILDTQVAQKTKLEAYLENKPTPAGDRPDPRTAEELSNISNTRRLALSEITELSRKVAQCIPPTMTVDQIAENTIQLNDYEAYSTFVARNPRCDYTPFKLEGFAHLNSQWNDHKNWSRDENILQTRITKLQEHLITCPDCNFAFLLDPDELSILEAELGALVYAPKPEAESPLTIHEIERERRILAAWETAPDAAVDPGYTSQELIEQTRLNELLPQRRGWEVELQNLQLDIPQEVSEDLIQRQTTWERESFAEGVYQSSVKDWTVELAKLKDVDLERLNVRTLYEQCWTYETLYKSYEALKIKYDKLFEKVEGYKATAKSYSDAKTIILGVKTEIKTLLLPSLNTIASRFLAQMTDGERSIVEIDEEFEILIDGIRLTKLSGSGKAVANLAIRLALGQVLTNRVFSVFIADEVDASMDDERAAYTAECLRRLTDLIGQVMLITHKNPEADQVLELTK